MKNLFTKALLVANLPPRLESTIQIGPYHGIMPSVQGWAQVTGYNTIIVDPRDPYAHGFEVN